MWMYAIPGAPVGPEVKIVEKSSIFRYNECITNQMTEVCITLVGVVGGIIG